MSDDETLDMVLPLDSTLAADQAELLDPWRLLATGNGIWVRWSEGGSLGSGMPGPLLAGSSQLASQLGSVLVQSGAAQASALARAGLFTLEVPNGSTIANLVPAVGGGFRGLVRSAGSSTIGGHVRLVPATGAAVAGGASLGPVIAVMALAVGAEMLARRQLDLKLARIYRGVEGLAQDLKEKRIAQLAAADTALQSAQAALLDRVAIPSSIGLGHARDNLRVLLNQALGWLEDWERAAKKMRIGSYGVHQEYFETRLLGGTTNRAEFAHRVAVLYQALVLDTRAEVLTSAEAAFHNPHLTLQNLQKQLESSVARNADAQVRLRDVLWRLSIPAVDHDFVSSPSTMKRAAALGRMLGELAGAVAYAPDAPPLLVSTGRQQLQIVRTHDGSVQPIEPASTSV